MIKKKEELEAIKNGGAKLGAILSKLEKMVEPGLSVRELDAEAERLIKEVGGEPSFKGYAGRAGDTPFPSVICASINEELVHGVANRDIKLKEGDIFSIDIGMRYPIISNQQSAINNSFFTDTALTVAVGSVPEEVEQLLERTKKSLEIGIEQVRAGNSIADIGKAIEDYLKPFNYGIIRALVGHGVGYAVNEPPQVPNYYNPALEKIKIKPGMVLALEPMVALGSYEVETLDDGWTIVTRDHSLCAHFEHSVVATEGEPLVVTRRCDES